jgi:N-acetylglutamate synthase-like GNAT family acetyltransferase
MNVGKALMEKLLEKAKAKGIKKLYLDSQIKAIGFYRKFGFHECSDILTMQEWIIFQ